MYLSLERLYHFRCGVCDHWWSIGDPDVTKTCWYCPWCGEKQYKRLDEPDYPKTETLDEVANKFCINFFEGPYGILQPDSAHPIMIDDQLFPTAEHAYQASKFTQPHIIEQIRTSRTIRTAQEIAYAHKEQRVVDWSELKVKNMEHILREKTRQYPEVRELLRRSGDAFLGEVSPTDHFWATGINGEGENWLGRIWMKIRQDAA